MEPPFPTSLRRDSGDPRSLIERIDSQLLERIEEACDFFCLDLLVQLRKARGLPAPETDNPRDREQFKGLVREFLVDLDKESRGWLGPQEKTPDRAQSSHPLALQVFLAKTLPDYWQRFDQATHTFASARRAPSPGKSFLNRLLRVKREE